MERTYIVPLRKEWLKAPKYRRAKKAINALRAFLVRHMKNEEVKIMPELNQEIWQDGIKSPPPRVKVNVKKDDNVVLAQLFGKKFPEKKVEETKKGLAAKLKEKVAAGEKKEKPAEKLKEVKKPKVNEVKEKAEKIVEKKEAAPVKKETEEKKAEKPVPKVEVPEAPVKTEEKPAEKPAESSSSSAKTE